MSKKGKCPYCGGKIELQYAKCKHCGGVIAEYQKERKRINIAGINFCPLPNAGIATIIALPFILFVNLLILVYHLTNFIGNKIIAVADKYANLNLSEDKKVCCTKITTILCWLILICIGLSPELNRNVSKYSNCDYACLAEKAYELNKKSKISTDKQVIYDELAEIQETMAEIAETTDKSIIEQVNAKYRSQDLFPKEMFKQ